MAIRIVVTGRVTDDRPSPIQSSVPQGRQSVAPFCRFNLFGIRNVGRGSVPAFLFANTFALPPHSLFVVGPNGI